MFFWAGWGLCGANKEGGLGVCVANNEGGLGVCVAKMKVANVQ